jgi:ribonucleoside-triphosphate reductase
MLKYGSEGAKNYYENFVLSSQQARAHSEGDIHIHDFDFYTLTTTCCQIDIKKLFEGGFSTGHGNLREPNSIQSYAALACIAIQSNQNDQHGGQSIPNFDYGLALGVEKSHKKNYISNFAKALKLLVPSIDISKETVKSKFEAIEAETGLYPTLAMKEDFRQKETAVFSEMVKDAAILSAIQAFATENAESETDRDVRQAMEALVHNLNTMHSRAGAQTPFSSINYGTDTSPEGRMVTRTILLATESGLGNGETAIFPINIFKVKEGVNYNPVDPNYDLFQLACRVSAKRLFPNFAFLDAPFNLKYYRPNRPETEAVYMGCRTRVIGNSYDPENEIAFGRGNLSFTSINLPRVALNSNRNIEWFFDELERKMELVCRQLLDRFKIQSSKKVRNFPFLMGQGIWIGSEKLSPNDEIGEVLKHGTLSIGFIGLAETLVALTGKHHGESPESRNLGLEIIGFMNEFLDRMTVEHGLNFSLLATPAEGLSGRFVRMDKRKFGEVKGVTDRDYYTNGFHVPVHFPISAYEKIQIEAPYHALTAAGHITYVELDGDASNNIKAFEKIVRTMKESGIGYGSVNHPVDRDPVCGYNGIINSECPKCGRKEDEHSVKFERIRRITGYLVGTLDRFNNAKRAEEAERVKHNV